MKEHETKSKKKASVVSLQLKLTSKKNLRKIQGKYYFVNYSSNRIFSSQSFSVSFYNADFKKSTGRQNTGLGSTPSKLILV